MKSQKHLNYAFFSVLLVAALFLAACGETMAASAAEVSPVAVEKMIEAAAVVDTTTVQDPPTVDEPINNEPDTSGPAASQNGYGDANSGQYGAGQGEHITPAGELSDAETAALLFMREEEKLARDVYQVLYDTWGVPIFANIAGSEQAHMDAIAYLLDSYDLPDPAAGKAVGEFTNPDLQALYTTLIAKGQQSQEDAMLVGAAIEEIDILDLQERLAQTDNLAVSQVFENLLAGSVNHLRAFVSNIERLTGATYTAQYMSAEAYEALISSTSGRGNGQGGNNSSGSGNGGGQGSGNGNGNGGGNGRGQGNGGGRGRSN